ncbi:uncharacterized protein TRUGW13939_09062 [Talaromyces rugulosus]|uniref:Uncharacterized protein n=1 Tax=Talaromyces rugulosus TaxID=121627 RepID=A0A7H8R6S3_TALRU|nr:uncharacterized protein TRUGW13939_09062 [Talaromyces rugulosus]QKX61906.1 hypothetical protein TRUGW13939_09062 [Talaromyces rugulosus]
MEGGRREALGRGRLPPCDYRPCFDWHLQYTAYPSHIHAQMACEELESTRLVKGAGIRQYHSSAPSKVLRTLDRLEQNGTDNSHAASLEIVIRSLELSSIP